MNCWFELSNNYLIMIINFNIINIKLRITVVNSYFRSLSLLRSEWMWRSKSRNYLM
ncbi:hypothetical protein D3C77_364370 [compost metagenome]